jgi:hypothetical protein
MNAHSRYPDTGESGETYDVERHSPPTESSLEATRLLESPLKVRASKARSAIGE